MDMNKFQTILRIQCDNLKFVKIFLLLMNSITILPSPTQIILNGILTLGEVTDNMRK